MVICFGQPVKMSVLISNDGPFLMIYLIQFHEPQLVSFICVRFDPTNQLCHSQINMLSHRFMHTYSK